MTSFNFFNNAGISAQWEYAEEWRTPYIETIVMGTSKKHHKPGNNNNSSKMLISDAEGATI